MKNKSYRNLILSLLSVMLLSIPWWGGSALSLFFAFVPWMIIADSTTKKSLFGWSSLILILWTVVTQYWVAYATIWGVIGASLVALVLFSVPFFLYKLVRAKAKKVLAYTVFVSAWVACEYLYIFNEQISHPWLVLGNGFANSVKIIQWFEYTGTLGGSLWVLIINMIIYESFAKKSKKYAIVSASLTIIPMAVSLIMYHNYKEDINPICVTVIQPNIDPYKDKFEGMSQMEQDRLIQSLAKESPKDVNYIVAPETSINDNVNFDNPLNSRSVRSYQQFMQENYPNAEFIIGATMYKFYPKTDERPTLTARETNDFFYDGINGSMQITADKIESYIKSRLVIGVEMVPFPQLFRNLKVDLGGMSGALITQPEREIFGKIAAPICYESIYGDYMTGFVRNGAQAIFIITNDGWWGDTFGCKHHFSYARLRAIETRRSVARSANTGISGFINQRGDVSQTLGWWKQGTLTENINLNTKMTFYATYGDVLGRMCSYILFLSLLYFVSYIYKKRSNLN